MAEHNEVFELHHIRLTEVKPFSATAIDAEWEDGYSAVVDLTSLMENPHFAGLQDPEVMAQASIEDWGSTITWPGDMEWGADNLRYLAHTQTFFTWMKRHKLTNKSAAEALGVSTRAVAYYKSGERPIPKHIRLACRAIDMGLVA
ncbi:conserved hypothetical protein [Magnetococcus marinus MC-1]|uniref:HTH cro/C1-type domain-containing protein n=1 Tax=Magnetococcus marinus (strain ATCC BAA-1437 / JCM 17883 / MC-1) TaxID=156889 RepID=A0L994_MAGMM|nr:DUF2442 domain-containing protein [Magnetococcus marinus]ABK44537.1 conserved hypothetical protein [Magnetococcus marinus MC-1]